MLCDGEAEQKGLITFNSAQLFFYTLPGTPHAPWMQHQHFLSFCCCCKVSFSSLVDCFLLNKKFPRSLLKFNQNRYQETKIKVPKEPKKENLIVRHKKSKNCWTSPKINNHPVMEPQGQPLIEEETEAWKYWKKEEEKGEKPEPDQIWIFGPSTTKQKSQRDSSFSLSW